MGEFASFGFCGFFLEPAIIALAFTNLLTLCKDNQLILAPKKTPLDKN